MNKLAILISVSALSIFAQSGDNPMSTAVKNQYTTAKTNLTKAAGKMSADDYAFKATADVRSFGQIVGHVADGNYSLCSAAQGEKSPNTASVEKTKTSKADLVAALNESFAYCDKAYDALTDATAAEKVKFGRGDMARLGVLTFNNMHDYEHYGNLVTYMRLKGVVPPSSEPRKQ
jgi:uncharacterized damage-inducible protein DinB